MNPAHTSTSDTEWSFIFKWMTIFISSGRMRGGALEEECCHVLGSCPTLSADGTKMAAWQIRLIIDEARSTTRAVGRCQVCPSVIFLTPLLLWMRRWGHAAARQKFLTPSSQRLRGTGPASANGQADRCPRSWSDEPTAVVADETLISGSTAMSQTEPLSPKRQTLMFSCSLFHLSALMMFVLMYVFLYAQFVRDSKNNTHA